MLALVTIIMFSSINAREMQAFGLAARNYGRLPHPYDSKFAAHIAVLQFSHRNLAGLSQATTRRILTSLSADNLLQKKLQHGK